LPDVFVSYNRDDREVARAVAAGLEAEGFSVWWDAALRAGEYYEEVTEKNLRSAAAVVVLWSKRSVGSKWVRAEATVGERSSVLVPALIEDCDRPVRFELVQTADLTRWTGDRNDPNWRAFVLDVREAVGRRGDAGSPVAKGEQAPRPDAPASSAGAGAGADSSVTIETTFWNSIKDGSERADFEAYLSRYPRGHFADLARNRLAALERAQRPTPAKPPASAPPARAAQPSAGARPAAPAAQRTARSAPPPAPPPQKKGGGIVIAGVAAALVASGAAAFLMMRSNTPPPAAAAAPQTEETAAAATTRATATPATSATETPAADQSAVELAAAPIDPTAATGAEPPSEDSVGDVFSESETPPPEGSLQAEAALEAAVAAAPSAPVAETEPAPAIEAKPKKVKAAKGAKKDCDFCPLMASLPGGAFVMGSPEGEAGRNAYEGPQHEVTIKRFRIGVYEVTAGEWAACVSDGACSAKRELGDPEMPALGVSWREATGYVEWLSKKTGENYRLPTEAEWEYAARAGTVTAYWWGETYDRSMMARDSVKKVGSFAANAFGMHDMHSNAREWVEDCYVNNFTQTPRDGTAARNGDCAMRVVRGGYWGSPPADTRSANRSRISQSGQPQYMGLRVAADAD
jgi:formylglycine-generating enzyme required for sulfatase activity